jgi:3-hydroxymyristoyl/3-hydroxydecanoyl-(acyl carrier protein) dehydratase
MRYRFIDEVTALSLDGTPRIEVVKTFDATDDAFTGPGGRARVPESLLLELMAMTGGHLIFQHLGERRLPLLLKVPECHFEGVARPGARLRAVAALRGASAVAEGADVVEAETEVYAGSERVAAGTLMYLCVVVAGVDLAAHGERL